METDFKGSGAGVEVKELKKSRRKRRKMTAKDASSAGPNPQLSATSALSQDRHSDSANVVHVDRATPTTKTGDGCVSSDKKRPRESVVANALNGMCSHPFPTEYGDHFETPLQAYRDIEGALSVLAKLLGKKRKHLRIWDPYVSTSVDTRPETSMQSLAVCA